MVVGGCLVGMVVKEGDINKELTRGYLDILITDIIFAVIMRVNGTKYPVIDALPANALPVSIYATNNNTAVGYIYVKYERYLKGEGKKPDYSIRCWNGANYVIPN
jgi:hypothetical protein